MTRKAEGFFAGLLGAILAVTVSLFTLTALLFRYVQAEFTALKAQNELLVNEVTLLQGEVAGINFVWADKDYKYLVYKTMKALKVDSE